jgi:catechol 2,3-dioxygenase-like lactoylglutathione lyase family enzyme
MRPRIDVITLAVSDLDRSLAFYRDGLGLHSPGVIGTEFPGDETTPAGAAAMFQLEGGLILALYPRTELLAQAEAAGATLTGEPHDRPWGIYSGYFRDPDGHLWEVIWNPQLQAGGDSHQM